MRLTTAHALLTAAGGHPYAKFALGMGTEFRGWAHDGGVYWHSRTVFGRTGHVLGSVPDRLDDDLLWINLPDAAGVPAGYVERERWHFRWTTGPAGELSDEVAVLGPDDYDDIAALLDLAYPHSSVRPGHALAVEWFGIRVRGELVACAVDRSTRHPDGGTPPWTVGVLGAVAVHPAHRGTGKGKLVAAHVTARLVERHGVATLALGADNESATRLYQRCGYAGLYRVRPVRRPA